MVLRKTVSILLPIVFPPRCPVCGEIRIPWEGSTCEACSLALPYIKEPVCFCCGREISDPEKEYCTYCEDKQFHFERCFAVWKYDKRMKASLAAFKYDGRTENVNFYADAMARSFQSTMKRCHIELLVPVPVTKKRKKVRGFNQAEFLASEIGKRTGVPVFKLLQRERETKPQNALSGEERKRNLTDAFRTDRVIFSKLQRVPESVAVVDDIFTTGSTMNACAEVLKVAGVKYVYGFCVCVGND